MGNTDKLLLRTYDLTDGLENAQNMILSIAGTTDSNMTKIDEFAIETDARLDEIETGDITVNQNITDVIGTTGTLLQILSWFSKMIKAIIGKTNWYDAPTRSLEQLNTDKIETSAITTSLLEETTGKVSDATVAKILDDKISILSQYRGVFASDANTIATNGWWRVQNGATNVPMPYGLIESKKIYLDADASGNYKYWEQTFTEFTISSSTKYYRTSYNDRVTWSPWQELATTDKIDISLLNGWKHTDNSTTFKAVKVGDTVTITDFFVVGTNVEPTTVFVLPEGLRNAGFDFAMQAYISDWINPISLPFSFGADGVVQVRGAKTASYCRFIITYTV